MLSLTLTLYSNTMTDFTVAVSFTLDALSTHELEVVAKNATPGCTTFEVLGPPDLTSVAAVAIDVKIEAPKLASILTSAILLLHGGNSVLATRGAIPELPREEICCYLFTLKKIKHE